MLVKLRYSVKGYGYFAGDTAELADAEAAELVEQGAAVIVPETEQDDGDKNPLPDDLPMRALLWKNGYESVEQILDTMKTLTDVKGIGEESAARIVEYCSDAVAMKLHDALHG